MLISNKFWSLPGPARRPIISRQAPDGTVALNTILNEVVVVPEKTVTVPPQIDRGMPVWVMLIGKMPEF